MSQTCIRAAKAWEKKSSLCIKTMSGWSGGHSASPRVASQLLPQLPYNVLALISKKADRPTQARMRALNRTTRADPLMRMRNPPKGKGYAFGTAPSRLQKLYNSMPQKLKGLQAMLMIKFEALEAGYESIPQTNIPALEELSRLVNNAEEYKERAVQLFYDFVDVRKAYLAMAKRAGQMVPAMPAMPAAARAAFTKVTGMQPPADAEKLMTVFLQALESKLRFLETKTRMTGEEARFARMVAVSPGNRSRTSQMMQLDSKEFRADDFVPNFNRRQKARASRIARRAARRLV